jgi:hypothetical protein
MKLSELESKIIVVCGLDDLERAHGGEYRLDARNNFSDDRDRQNRRSSDLPLLTFLSGDGASIQIVAPSQRKGFKLLGDESIFSAPL